MSWWLKNRLSDDEVTQVLAVILAHMEAKTRDVPRASAPRNADEDMKKKIHTIVPQLQARNLISADGANYLLQWSSGALPRHPRPEYRWLQHRWKCVAGLPEARLSDLSGVDVLRDMKRIRCNWRVRGSCLNRFETHCSTSSLCAGPLGCLCVFRHVNSVIAIGGVCPARTRVRFKAWTVALCPESIVKLGREGDIPAAHLARCEQQLCTSRGRIHVACVVHGGSITRVAQWRMCHVMRACNVHVHDDFAAMSSLTCARVHGMSHPLVTSGS